MSGVKKFSVLAIIVACVISAGAQDETRTPTTTTATIGEAYDGTYEARLDPRASVRPSAAAVERMLYTPEQIAEEREEAANEALFQKQLADAEKIGEIPFFKLGDGHKTKTEILAGILAGAGSIYGGAKIWDKNKGGNAGGNWTPPPISRNSGVVIFGDNNRVEQNSSSE